MPHTMYVANLTIYLPDDVERKVRIAAGAANTSLSKWVADQIGRSVETSWPAEFLAPAGAFPELAEADHLRRGYGEDVRRDTLD